MKRPALNPNDQKVLTELGRSEKPLSAYDILDRARSDTLKAPVQVYRALQKLEERGFVHRIEALSAFVACTEHGYDHDHTCCDHRPGFVICRDCGSVREFEDDRLAEMASSAAGDGFSVELISLEVYGRCAACREAAKPDAEASR